jgi:Family of unknown function (DUF6174)
MKPSLSLRFRFAQSVFAFLLLAGRAFSATAYDSLEENRQRWNANHPHEYAFTYRISCFCNNPVWRVEVKGDSVVRVANISPSAPGSPSALESYSMDSIFGRIKQGLDKHPARTQIRYNTRLGYPEQAGFDLASNVADDEYYISISDFIAATPADTLAFYYAKWKAHRPDRYAYTYSRGLTCSCVYPVWRVEARGDSVIGVTQRYPTLDTILPEADLRFYSMDSIFARVQAALDSGPDAHSIRYDTAMGFPVQAYFDQDRLIVDAGYSYNVTEFTNLTVAIGVPSPASRGRSGMGWGMGRETGAGRDLKGRKALGSGVAPVFPLRR